MGISDDKFGEEPEEITAAEFGSKPNGECLSTDGSFVPEERSEEVESPDIGTVTETEETGENTGVEVTETATDVILDTAKTDEYASSVRAEENFAERIRSAKYNRTPLIFSFISLLSTVFYGIGLPLAVFSFIFSIVRYKKAGTRPLRWAAVISLAALVLSVLYLVCLFYIFGAIGTPVKRNGR